MVHRNLEPKTHDPTHGLGKRLVVWAARKLTSVTTNGKFNNVQSLNRLRILGGKLSGCVDSIFYIACYPQHQPFPCDRDLRKPSEAREPQPVTWGLDELFMSFLQCFTFG